MRLGGPTFRQFDDPAVWIAELRRLGYGAAYCPVDEQADAATVADYARAAQAADIVIAEVGAWSNPLSPDTGVRRAAIELCQKRLALAEAIGARCCVNIAGSRGTVWDGPDPANYADDTFDLIVAVTREIIDAVRPMRACYTLETMPWIAPDSIESYQQLIRAIDRRAFGVHLDPVNLITSPGLFFRSGDFLRECFARLGPHIRSCHAKDVALDPRFISHLSEVRPGLGNLDYVTFLTELSRLDVDAPLMLEHLEGEADYAAAAAHVRAIAARAGLAFAGT